MGAFVRPSRRRSVIWSAFGRRATPVGRSAAHRRRHGQARSRELNFSSDIDLVFLYAEAGETDGARTTDNAEYFNRLGREVIRLLDARTAEGQVFRVDMRLRPFGDSGGLVVSLAALEDYLQEHGRDWERYAWIKARAVVGLPPTRRRCESSSGPSSTGAISISGSSIRFGT